MAEPPRAEPDEVDAGLRRGRLLSRLSVVLFVAGGLLVVAAIIGAVVGGGGSTSTDPPAGSSAGSSSAGRSALGTAVPAGPFAGFRQVGARLRTPDGHLRTPCLLAAVDDAHRARGLMQVTDPSLDGHGGMVFVFDAPTETPFWMRNTPMPLSIAFYAADGSFVSSTDMAPCGDRPSCPTYAAAGAYRLAVEVPQGELAARGLVPGSALSLTGACR